MNAPEVIAALTEILAEILVLNKGDIRPSSKLVDDLDADSIAFLELTYRLRKDLGLKVPEAKVDEETLRLPLLQGLERLEHAIGGTTLFEFLKLEAVNDGVQDPALRARTLEMLRQSLLESPFADTVKGAASASADAGSARATALLLYQLRRTPELADTVASVRAADGELARCMDALETLAAAEIARAGPPDAASLIPLWREAAGMDRAAAELGAFKIKQLAYLVGTDVPRGHDPEAPIARLELRDMFRFITVEGYVRYVLYLAAAQRPGELGDADAISAAIASWLRDS